MSQILINQYLAEIDRLKKYAGTATEEVIRDAFRDLLRGWAKQSGLVFASELPVETPTKTTVKPDGTILHDIRVPLGYWEAKDENDDLEAEIAAKFRKGYPQDNILFEDSKTAILWQNRSEVLRCDMLDTAALAKLVTLFFAYERPEIAQFRKAVEQFKTDLPAVLTALRDQIDTAYDNNPDFAARAADFLKHAKQTINPTLTEADVREMLIQHILTEEIFNKVFDEGDFHRDNNIAKALYALERLFFRGAVKKDTLRALQPYYTAINANAEQITSHTEKQTFLKVIYENFYKVYNPDAADRLGVVYTPNEIVRFMIEGADWLCHTHFGKTLIDQGVEILDPATGTGTFICELIEHFRGQPEKLARKYREELHANEVAILPYYVANLNIEATYAAVSGQYAEYPNLCFVDTLDSVDGLGIKSGHQMSFLGALSDENVERVNRQNRRPISIVIGNPPYNAQQTSVGDDNQNRSYPHIDKLVYDSITKHSSATKGRNQDPFIRFYRWASDRIHDVGMVCFITNRSFLDGGSHDGFRHFIKSEFDDAYFIELGGSWRRSDIAGGENVFENIGTGVAIAFLVKTGKRDTCSIKYGPVCEDPSRDGKLAALSSTRLSDLQLESIQPDNRDTWLDQPTESWDGFISLFDDRTKAEARPTMDRAVFRHFALGVSTNRDKWAYSLCQEEIPIAQDFVAAAYEAGPIDAPEKFKSIGWSDTLKSKYKRGLDFNNSDPIQVHYRPFVIKFLIESDILADRPGVMKQSFPDNSSNSIITLSDINSRGNYCVTSSKIPADLHIGDTKDGYQCLPRYRPGLSGERIDNITDWALNKFHKHYKTKTTTKDDIFHYVYGVLHNPIFRETYALNLKREFPRIPFYPDFAQWAAWGARLMDLHINYETAAPFPLTRRDLPDAKSRAAGLAPQTILRADKDAGTITLDGETVLEGVPPEAWEYRLGNRSGLEWVLDQHKERTSNEPEVRKKLNAYRFADYKEKVVDLLGRVTTVSVETMAITDAMRALPRAAEPD